MIFLEETSLIPHQANIVWMRPWDPTNPIVLNTEATSSEQKNPSYFSVLTKDEGSAFLTNLDFLWNNLPGVNLYFCPKIF